MRILFLGDIVGKKGREVIRDSLSFLKDKYKPDFTIVNGENAAHGKGITIKIYNDLINLGVDCITMGNHTYSKKEILEYIPGMDKLVVPNNFVNKVGEGYRIFNVNGKRLCVANILGVAFMGEYMTNPYESYQEILDSTNADIYFVDFHGEATAEKRLFAEYFRGYVDIVVGTHTHIQTADEDVLYGEIAFISDVGMCGPYYSVIGRDINESISSHIFNNKTRYETCEEEAILCGVIVDVDENTNTPTHIERIQIRP